MAPLSSDHVQYALVADERGYAPAVMARAMSRTAYLREMTWLMPRMCRAISYPGYGLVSARQPVAPVVEAA